MKNRSTMGWGSGAWVVVMVMTGCIAQLPDEGVSEDDGGSDESAGEASHSATSLVTQPTGEDTDWGGSVSLTASNDSVSTTDSCGECTMSGGSVDSGGTAESGEPGLPSVCGVDIVHDPSWNNTYVCGCEACNVEFNHLEPASGEAVLAECECICYEVGCGGSVTGGATSEGYEDSGGWSDTGDTSGETGVETDSASIGTTDPTFGSDDDATASASASDGG